MAGEASDWQVSTVPQAKATLFGLMQAEDTLAGVTIGYSDPGVARLEKEHVFLGNAGQPDEGWAPFGHLKRKEDYVIDLFVHAAKAGQSGQEATERAFQLLGYVALMIRPYARRATVIAPGVWSVEIRFADLTEFSSPDGFGALVKAQFHIQSRI